MNKYLNIQPLNIDKSPKNELMIYEIRILDLFHELIERQLSVLKKNKTKKRQPMLLAILRD